MVKMKISTLLEILLILIIVSFAASKPINEGKWFCFDSVWVDFTHTLFFNMKGRGLKHKKVVVALDRQEPGVAPAPAPVKPDDDDDFDIFDLFDDG